MRCHENASTTFLGGADAVSASHFSAILHLVELEHTQLNIFVLVLVLLGLGVRLLLPLLASTKQAAENIESGSFCHARGTQHRVLIQLMAAVNQAGSTSRNACKNRGLREPLNGNWMSNHCY
jgi:hypothetical protein